MPAVRLFSITFIEFVRGVPLITVLFMASVMLPLFVPDRLAPDKLVRALIGVALFASAYMAEVVRGGLLSIPRGQYEAAQALALPYWRMMAFVILPQALRVTLPNIVNTFIARRSALGDADHQRYRLCIRSSVLLRLLLWHVALFTKCRGAAGARASSLKGIADDKSIKPDRRRKDGMGR